MITDEQYKENGFKSQGFWNNRSYYEKNGFKIVEHNGNTSRCDDKHWSGYGDYMNTIEELCEGYNKWAKDRIEQLEKELNQLKNSL